MKSIFIGLRSKIQSVSDHIRSSRFKKLIWAALAYAAVMLVSYLVLKMALPQPNLQNEHHLVLAIEVPEKPTGSAEAISEKINSIDRTERFLAPFNRSDTRPRIALIIKGLGLHEMRTKKAILDLPPAVTLAFSPYATDTSFWIEQSIQNRHETLISIPFETEDFPNQDPGPLALTRGISTKLSMDHLETIQNMGGTHIGYINDFGDVYTRDIINLKALYAWARSHNALFIEHLYDPDAFVARPEFIAEHYIHTLDKIDHIATPDRIVTRLKHLEREAQKKGYAIGVASDYPVTLEVIKKWAETVEKRGMTLSPISAVLERRNEHNR